VDIAESFWHIKPTKERQLSAQLCVISRRAGVRILIFGIVWVVNRGVATQG